MDDSKNDSKSSRKILPLSSKPVQGRRSPYDEARDSLVQSWRAIPTEDFMRASRDDEMAVRLGGQMLKEQIDAMLLIPEFQGLAPYLWPMLTRYYAMNVDREHSLGRPTDLLRPIRLNYLRTCLNGCKTVLGITARAQQMRHILHVWGYHQPERGIKDTFYAAALKALQNDANRLQKLTEADFSGLNYRPMARGEEAQLRNLIGLLQAFYPEYALEK